MPRPGKNSMFIEHVSPCEVLAAANKLKPKTSFGHDCISNLFLKESIDIILEPITHIVNISFQTGIVPTDMKLAKVIQYLRHLIPIC